MDRHLDLLHLEPGTGEERYVGRVEVRDGLVVVSDQRMDRLDELVLIPRFRPGDGAPVSLTEQPHAYLSQLADDLGGELVLRATALHADAGCRFRPDD
jgi:hypothetical protein